MHKSPDSHTALPQTQDVCQGEYFVFKDGNVEGETHVRERIWEKNQFNFNNVAEAMLTLFVVSTFEGWPG